MTAPAVSRTALCTVKGCPFPNDPDFHVPHCGHGLAGMHQHVPKKGMAAGRKSRIVAFLCPDCTHEVDNGATMGNAILKFPDGSELYRLWRVKDNSTVCERQITPPKESHARQADIPEDEDAAREQAKAGAANALEVGEVGGSVSGSTVTPPSIPAAEASDRSSPGPHAGKTSAAETGDFEEVMPDAATVGVLSSDGDERIAAVQAPRVVVGEDEGQASGPLDQGADIGGEDANTRTALQGRPDPAEVLSGEPGQAGLGREKGRGREGAYSPREGQAQEGPLGQGAAETPSLSIYRPADPAILATDLAGASDEDLQMLYIEGEQRQQGGFLLKCKVVAAYRDGHVQAWGESWIENAYELFHASRRTLMAYANVWAVFVQLPALFRESFAPLTDSKSLMQFIGQKTPEEGVQAVEAAVAYIAEFGEIPTVAALAHALGAEVEAEPERHACPDCGADHRRKV